MLWGNSGETQCVCVVVSYLIPLLGSGTQAFHQPFKRAPFGVDYFIENYSEIPVSLVSTKQLD